MTHYSDGGRFGWHVTADVRHEHYEHELLEISALARSVRAGQDLHEAATVTGIRVVRDVRYQELVQRMPTLFHRYDLTFHHVRPHVIVFARNHVERQ